MEHRPLSGDSIEEVFERRNAAPLHGKIEEGLIGGPMNQHLSFNGQCQASFRPYEECLGGRISFMLTLMHVGIGILAGGCITGALAYGVMRGALGLGTGVMIVAYAALVMGVCLLACDVPMQRAPHVEPPEALRQD
jgi:hypothetical protein